MDARLSIDGTNIWSISARSPDLRSLLLLAYGLQFIDQFFSSAEPVFRRHKFECEARWLVTVDARMIAREMLEEP